jgi:hypothetical protein
LSDGNGFRNQEVKEHGGQNRGKRTPPADVDIELRTVSIPEQHDKLLRKKMRRRQPAGAEESGSRKPL